MRAGRSVNPGRHLVLDHQLVFLIEHFDVAGFDHFLECGALNSFVVDLTSAGRSEEQSLAARKRNLDRFAGSVGYGFDGRISCAESIF